MRPLFLEANDSPAGSVASPAAPPEGNTPARIEPLPWPGLSKAECVLLAIALHSIARTRMLGD